MGHLGTRDLHLHGISGSITTLVIIQQTSLAILTAYNEYTAFAHAVRSASVLTDEHTGNCHSGLAQPFATP